MTVNPVHLSVRRALSGLRHRFERRNCRYLAGSRFPGLVATLFTFKRGVARTLPSSAGPSQYTLNIQGLSLSVNLAITVFEVNSTSSIDISFTFQWSYLTQTDKWSYA